MTEFLSSSKTGHLSENNKDNLYKKYHSLHEGYTVGIHSKAVCTSIAEKKNQVDLLH